MSGRLTSRPVLERLLRGLPLQLFKEWNEGLLIPQQWRCEVEFIGACPPQDPCSLGLTSVDSIAAAFGFRTELVFARMEFEQYLVNLEHLITFARHAAGACTQLDDETASEVRCYLSVGVLALG